MSTTTNRPELTRTDRVVLRIVQISAWVGVAITAFSATATTVLYALNGITGAPLMVQVSTSASRGDLSVGGDQWVQAVLFVQGQAPALTGAMMAALILRNLGTVLVLLGLAILAGRMLRGRGFAAAAGMPLGLVLVGVALAPIAADALEAWVSRATWDALGNPASHGAVAGFGPGPLFLGVVVVAVMILFRVGARMQRETEGLV